MNNQKQVEEPFSWQHKPNIHGTETGRVSVNNPSVDNPSVSNTPKNDARIMIQELETTLLGGIQHRLSVRYDALDQAAIQKLAELRCFALNELHYPRDNWRAIDTQDNLNHALDHINNVLDEMQILERAGVDPYTENQEKITEELTHAFCRMMFALGVYIKGGPVSVK